MTVQLNDNLWQRVTRNFKVFNTEEVHNLQLQQQQQQKHQNMITVAYETHSLSKIMHIYIVRQPWVMRHYTPTIINHIKIAQSYIVQYASDCTFSIFRLNTTSKSTPD